MPQAQVHTTSHAMVPSCVEERKERQSWSGLLLDMHQVCPQLHIHASLDVRMSKIFDRLQFLFSGCDSCGIRWSILSSHHCSRDIQPSCTSATAGSLPLALLSFGYVLLV